MNNDFIKKTNLHFDINEIIAGLELILEHKDMSKILENYNQLSLCGENLEDGLYNIKAKNKLSRTTVREEKKFTNLNNNFKNTIWEKIWESLKNYSEYNICRMSIRKMKHGTSLLFHKDYTIRWHLAMKTNSFAFMTFLDKNNNNLLNFNIPSDGYIYFTNTTIWHTAVNAGSEDRYSLIISTYEN